MAFPKQWLPSLWFSKSPSTETISSHSQILWPQVQTTYANALMVDSLWHFAMSSLLGIILTIVHSMALGYSAMIIIIERNEGLLDRTWVAGVTAGEFALAHFIVSLVVNLLQVIVTLVFMILIFQVRC